MQKEQFLDHISEKIEQSDSIKGTRKNISEGVAVRFGEVGELGKVLLAYVFSRDKACLVPTGNKKILFLTKTKSIEGYVSNLTGLGFKNFEVLNRGNFANFGVMNLDAMNRVSTGEKKGDKKILFADFDLMFEKVPSLEEFQNSFLKLKTGDKISTSLISNKLVDLGFEKVKKVESGGEFSLRGDTLEVGTRHALSAPSYKKYRVEFFGNTVEKISGADVGTRHALSLRDLEIYPLTIPKGNDFLIQWFENHLFIIDSEDHLRSAVFDVFQIDDKKVSPDEILEMKRIEDFLKKQARVYLENFYVSNAGGINLGWFGPRKFNGLLIDFVDVLKLNQHLNPKNEENFIFTQESDKLKKFFRENIVENANIFEGDLSEGVDLRGLDIKIFSDREIFAPPRRRGKGKVDFSALTNLKKGEYVVHIDHGIGIFSGFGELTVDGIKREYIFIEYSGGDKIYVPFDQADKITKYISVGNSAPLLSSLKTAQWLKVRKKVQENVEKIAKELIENQALRVGDKKFQYTDDRKEQEKLRKTFQYHETPDQTKAIESVLEDMKEKKPMDRLVCGDVGYGKTEVAIRASARAVLSGGQVAILAPTTILAEQHLQTFRDRLGQFGFEIESLSRFRSKDDQKKVIEKVKKGSVDIVIGTHRLLSSDIKFKNLFLIVIDEEQKFGVKQKEKLKTLRDKSDLLVMTATPIPRTLYMGLSGLKDISVIATPPEGRLPIKTVVVKNEDSVIQDAIEKEVARGGQVYFVHNRVETIQAVAHKLHKLLPKIKMEVAHGQMGEEKLARIMNDFGANHIQVLICSTIIESGLDISTVNTLIIDKATNFGLSQLHQLRGRIGRSARQAYAYLLYDSQDLKGNAERRLKTITEKGSLGSGYELSLEDLDIRGSGNILGSEQHGSMQMVGVGYYLRLLEEAVERMNLIQQGHPEQGINISDIKIDLPLSAYIPDGFFEKEEEKIRAYQSLSSLEEVEELDDFIRNLENKKQEIPQEIKNLFEIIRIKIMAKDVGVKSIVVKDVLTIFDAHKKKLYIDLDHVLSREEIRTFLLYGKGWYFGNTQVQVDLEDLGKEWVMVLEKILSGLNQD